MEVNSRARRDVGPALSQTERRFKRWSPTVVLVTDFNSRDAKVWHYLIIMILPKYCMLNIPVPSENFFTPNQETLSGITQKNIRSDSTTKIFGIKSVR